MAADVTLNPTKGTSNAPAPVGTVLPNQYVKPSVVQFDAITIPEVVRPDFPYRPVWRRVIRTIG